MNAPIFDMVWSMPNRPRTQLATRADTLSESNSLPDPHVVTQRSRLIGGKAVAVGTSEINADGELVFRSSIAHGEWRLDIVFESINGRPEPTMVQIARADGGAVTGTAIRSLPLGELLHDERRWIVKEAQGMVAISTRRPPPSWNEHLPKAAGFVATGPHRGRGHSEAELEQVAAVYRAAFAVGDSVQRAVAEALMIAPSTATKRIMAARKAGLLEGIGRA